MRPSARMRAARPEEISDDIRTPYLGTRHVVPAPRSRPTLNPPPPAHLLDIEEIDLEEVEVKDDTGDREPTVALAREELAPVSSRVPPTAPPRAKLDALPIPHFRSQAKVEILITPTPSQAAGHPQQRPSKGARTGPAARSLPMFAWLLASILAAMLSYHYAPSALRAAERAVGTLEVR